VEVDDSEDIYVPRSALSYFYQCIDLISQFSEYIGITQPAVGYAKGCLISWEGQSLKFR
jgi:hypothetical protein